MSTPRTDAVYPPEIIAEQFKKQGRNWGWGTLHDMRECSVKLETELAAMRKAMSQVATNIGNGSFASPDASPEWLTKEVPEEVRLYCARLRGELAAERENVAKLRGAMQRYAECRCGGDFVCGACKIIAETAPKDGTK